MHRCTSSRRAFTLVELMVVISIIAALCAMIFVAIQKLRGSAAQTQCINNLKQIGLAAQNYYDANDRLPPGFSKQTQAGVLMYLLPYIDQNVTANLPAPLTKGTGGNWWAQFPSNGLAAGSPVSTRIPNFECPAAGLYSANYANGTVQYETLGGSGGSQQLTLRQMLASSNTAIKTLGQSIANNLNQIYYAAWGSQTLVWEISDFGAKQGRITLPLEGGSVTVTGGTIGNTGIDYFFDIFQTYSGGTVWMATGSFTLNGQKFDVNLTKPNLFLTASNGAVQDLSSYVSSGVNIVLWGHYYDDPSPFALFGLLLGLGTNQEWNMILSNPAPITNQIWPITMGQSLTARPQDNPLFWAYYDATYGAVYTYTVGGAPAGFAMIPNNPADSTMGRTSYVGNSGTYGLAATGSGFTPGPYFPDSAVANGDISDGLANTIAFGESLGGPETPSRQYALTWMGTGLMPSYWDCQTPSTWFTFGSGHTHGCNFAFCDGSVRTITKVTASPADATGTPPAKINSARWTVFQQLAGISDGAAPDLTKLD